MRMNAPDMDDSGRPAGGLGASDRLAAKSGSDLGVSDCLRVSRLGDAVRIEVSGLGNLRLAPTLRIFVESELRAGTTNFVVDLANCRGMDSTFMGTFIGLSAEIKSRLGWFCLANVSPDNLRLLRMLGVLHLISVHDGRFPAPEEEAAVINPTNDPYARQKQIREAHLLLMEADPVNRERFGPFIQALEAEMTGAPIIIPPRAGGKAVPENGD
jgi:anti-anti-sigma factor